MLLQNKRLKRVYLDICQHFQILNIPFDAVKLHNFSINMMCYSLLSPALFCLLHLVPVLVINMVIWIASFIPKNRPINEGHYPLLTPSLYSNLSGYPQQSQFLDTSLLYSMENHCKLLVLVIIANMFIWIVSCIPKKEQSTDEM